ncbi:MAG TPA: hypothetical protein VG144_05110 [Gaiellaceae bacterium]|jgi:hypothetical protein|nr:hypothetical protein [Gaiellaceae bacterium]
MAATTEEETKMRRRKRFTIKFVALGFAVSALMAAPAQAGLDEGYGMQKQSPATLGPDDRSLSRISTAMIPSPVVSPDDRAISRVSPDTINQPQTVATTNDGYEVVDFGVAGLVLLLGVASILMAVRHVQHGRLANA